jgi:hypothetical protein
MTLKSPRLAIAPEKTCRPFPSVSNSPKTPSRNNGKSSQFKYELAEDRRRDGREHSKENIEFEEEHLIERHAESQPTKNPDLRESEVLQPYFSCWKKLANRSTM